MNRRKTLGLLGAVATAAGAGLISGVASAHHGWSSFDPNRPFYLAGRIKAVRWRNPHAEVDIEPSPGLALPAGLAAREVPAQVSPIDAPALLGRTLVVPKADVVWTVELAPLTRMSAWEVEPLKEGETVEIVGYTLADQSEPVLRAEWLFRDGKGYGLRSSPAR